MTQLQAGYILDGINDSLKSLNKPKEVKGLLRHLSCFDLETDCDISSNSSDSFASVIHNLIVRGIPTRPSIFIENKFLETFQKFQIDNSDFTKQLGNIKYESKLNEGDKNSVFSALHIIDPRIRLTREDYAFTYDQNGKREQSNFEEAFLFDYLPEVKQEFFIEQPISIEATGDYHAYGAFVTGIAALPRIVTLHDFVVEANADPQKKSDIPVVNYSIKAKTYRYIGADDQANAQTATPPAQGGTK